jgi:hypothetical protein
MAASNASTKFAKRHRPVTLTPTLSRKREREKAERKK